MKVTFDIEIDDALVSQLDYYANFGELGSKGAGCTKCIFHSMCAAFNQNVSMAFDGYHVDCKFPCWANKADRLHGSGRMVIVPTPCSK